jgi:prepilin-type N-terminal cleavage/methylation domain-containing protein
MNTTTRRGFTLVELMVALVLMTMVGGVTYQLLLNTQRVSRAQSLHADLQDNVRLGALVVANELREVGYDNISAAILAAECAGAPASNPDLMLAEPGRVQYKAMRGIGFVCSIGANQIVVKAASYQGIRGPTTTDSVAVYVEDKSNTNADDVWIHGKITAVANQNCPDGKAGTKLTVTYPAWEAGKVAGRVVLGGPVRVFEPMEIRYYAAGGKSWLGMRSLSTGEEIQPILGPLADEIGDQRGFTLTYLDVNNAPTAVLDNVRSIGVTLKGVTSAPIRPTGYGGNTAVDSLQLTTRVALRNALRP